MWSKLQHSNVQSLLGVVTFQGELGMVSPWMEQGDLDQYIKDHPNVERYQLVCPVWLLDCGTLSLAFSAFSWLWVYHTFTALGW